MVGRYNEFLDNLLVVVVYLFYPAFRLLSDSGTSKLKLKNNKFPKRDMEFNYSDLSRVEVSRKGVKSFGTFIRLRFFCNDGRSYYLGLMTDLELAEDLCCDLRSKGVMEDNRI